MIYKVERLKPDETIVDALDRNYLLAKRYFDHNFILKGAARAADQRLFDAAAKAGIPYYGCDTADHLAEEVLSLRAEAAASSKMLGDSEV